MAARKYFTVVTDIGQSKIAEAVASGRKLNLTTFVVGDGNGNYYTPTSDMTAIKKEVWRGSISKTEILQDAQKLLRITTVIPAEVSGFVVREMGLLDETGELIAIGNSPDMPKVALQDGASTELKLTIRVAVKNSEALSFIVDPHMVIMTKDMLDTHNIDETAHQELFKEKYDKTGGAITGDVDIDGDVNISGGMKIENGVDGFNVNTSTGDISLESSTGDISLNTSTGDISLNTSTGDINISSTYRMRLSTNGADGIMELLSENVKIPNLDLSAITSTTTLPITKGGTGNKTGNAATATKLQTARTLALSGDVTGSASFDGSANKTIAATLANSGVTAGTYGPLELPTKNSGTVWVSNNVGLHSTSAISTWTAKQACKISFRWRVSSESSGTDYLNITAAGTQILANTGGATEQTGTLTATLAANQTIVFTYRKDGSVNKGIDRAEISEVKYGAGTTDPSVIIYENNVESYFTITNSTYGFYPGIPIANVTVDTKGRITKEQTTYIAPTYVKKADRLATSRTLRTNLASTSTSSFDGTANITPGVTGTLPIANGGTGATSASTALSNLGGFPR